MVLDGVSAGVTVVPKTQSKGMSPWMVVFWFLLLVFLGLMVSPSYDVVMWGLVLLAVVMLIGQAPEIAQSVGGGGSW